MRTICPGCRLNPHGPQPTAINAAGKVRYRARRRQDRRWWHRCYWCGINLPSALVPGWSPWHAAHHGIAQKARRLAHPPDWSYDDRRPKSRASREGSRAR